MDNTPHRPATPPKRRISLQPSLHERLAELERVGAHLLPVWIRAPKTGPEHFTGFSRSKLYELAGDGKIRSVSIREPGEVRGTRLFHLQSTLEFIETCEASQAGQDANGAADTISARN